MRYIKGLRLMPKTWFKCTLHARYFILSNISTHNKLQIRFYKILMYPSLCVPYSAGVRRSAWHKTDTHIFVVLMTGRIISCECLYRFIIIILPHHLACAVLVPQPGIKSAPGTGRLGLDHWLSLCRTSYSCQSFYEFVRLPKGPSTWTANREGW